MRHGSFLSLLLVIIPTLIFSSPKPTPLEQVTLQLKWKHQFQFAGYYAAIEQGYYKEAGLEVILKEHQPGMDVADEVVSGRAQYGVFTSSLLLDYDNKKPVKIMAVIFQHSPSIIIIPGELDINSPHDLYGKKIMNTRYDFEINAMLQHEGVSTNDYERVPVDYTLESLLSGKVQGFAAYITDTPYTLDLLDFSYRIIQPISYGVDFYGDCLFSSKQEIKQHPGRAQAFLKASLKGWEYALEHQEEIVELILDKYSNRHTKDQLLYEARTTYNLILPKLIEIGHMNPGRWKHISQTFQELGYLSTNFSLKGLFYESDQTINLRVIRWVAWGLAVLLLLFLIISSTLYLFNRKLNSEVSQKVEELSRNEHIFRGIFDNHAQLTGLLTPEGILTQINRSALDMIGAEEKDLTGKYFWDCPWWTHSPEFQEQLKEGISKSAQGEFIEFEATHKNVTGEERNIAFSIKPILDKSGKVISLLPEGRDITDIKNTQKSLLREKGFLESTIDSQPGIFYMYNSDMKLIRWNKNHETMLGYSSKDLFHKEVLSFFQENDRNKITTTLGSVFKQGEGTVDAPILTKDGTTIPFLLSARLFTIDEQQYVIGHGIDIRELKETQRGLQHAQKMEAVGTLAGGIAHDFNNILTAIMGYLELAIMGIDQDSETAELLAKVLSASDRAKQLVSQILAFSHKDNSQSSQHKAVQLSEIVNDALKLLRASIPTTIDFKTVLDSQSRIIADPTQLHQIILNLCTNAYHAMEEDNGVLTVEVSEIEIKDKQMIPDLELRSGQYIRLTISDTGCGIPRDVIDKIFDPYYTTKETGKGTGLGLSLVQGIVKNMNGNITVYSEVGKGSSFNLYFPIVSEPADAVTTLPQSAHKLKGKEKILLIDDEPTIIDLTRKALEKFGYQVNAFSDSMQALQEFQAHPDDYDLILSDITMPHLTGLGLAKKAIETRSNIPIILSSGYNSKFNSIDKSSDNIKAYLKKPTSLMDLLTAVRNVLDGDQD